MKIIKRDCTKCGQAFLPDQVFEHICKPCKEINCNTCTAPINDQVVKAELEGAHRMFDIVKKWLNTEPIEKEIWRLFNEKMS